MEKTLFILIFSFASLVQGKTFNSCIFSDFYYPVSQNLITYPIFSDTSESSSGTNKEDLVSDSLSSLSDSSKFINYGVNLLWQQPLNTPIEALPLIWENKVYIATKEGYINCLDKNGKLLWQTYISGTIVSQPAAADNYLAVGTLEGDISSLNAKTGKLLQTIGIGEPITAPLMVFEFLGPRDIIIDNDNLSTSIAIGTQSGKLYCYDLSSFGYLWESDIAKAEINTKPIFKDNKLMYLDSSGHMYCLDSRSGKMIWKWSNSKFNSDGPFTSPVSNGDDIFVAASEKSIAAVDMLLGNSDWFKENLAGELSINLSQDSTKLIASSNANKFYFLSAKDGKIIKELDPLCRIDTVIYPPIETSGGIISGSSEGKIFRIDNNFNQIPLLFIGNNEILSIQSLNKKNIIAVTKSGEIFVFEIQQ